MQPRFHLHFLPTSASWLNTVECFFRTLSIHRLRRDLFAKVDILVAIIQQHSQQLKPFICAAKARDMLEKVKRARAVLDRRLTG